MAPTSRKYALVGAVLLLVALAAGVLLLASQKARSEVRLGGHRFSVQVADTPQEREQGLSGTAQLRPDEGMLFVFGADKYHSIWMKDMNYPIDIVWLDSEKTVVSVAENVSPDTFPQSFRPSELSRYVVELPAGSAGKYGIQTSTKVQFTLAN